MASRSDQLHSHQFTRQRAIKALALRDPDAVASPTGRAGGALLASVMVAVLVLAVVGVIEVLRPSGDGAWRDGRAVIIEEETGARFVLRSGVLHPVLNHASALLLLGSQPLAPVRVPRSALATVPRGVTLGIPGAPDPLPAAADLVTGAWSVCSRPAGDATRAAESVLGVAGAMESTPLAERALLAQDGAGGLHVVWHGYRFAVAEPRVATAALGWSGAAPVAVANAVLNAIPAGPPIAAPAVPVGGASAMTGHQVGEVFVLRSEGGQRRYAVALAGGLADITQVQADLLLADPGRRLAGATALAPADYVTAARADSLVPAGPGAPPAQTPALVEAPATAAVCASFTDATTAPVVGLRLDPGPAAGAVRVSAAAAANGPLLADWVAMPPGRGVLVESRTGDTPGALSLVTDLGVRFPLPSAEVRTMLGYGAVAPVLLPNAVVALLPTGSALDPAAAAVPVSVG